MKRLFTLALLAALLSSCILLVDDTPPAPKGPTVVPVPNTQTVVAVPAPGSYTYTCTGGRLVVKYVDNNSVQVFYDNAFQNLNLSSNSSSRVYSGGGFVWTLDSSGRGSFSTGGQQVRSGCTV